jgi:hypothetical protein
MHAVIQYGIFYLSSLQEPSGAAMWGVQEKNTDGNI